MRRAALFLGALVTVAACSNDGRTLREPSPNQTASIITTTLPPTTQAPAFVLTGPWSNGSSIPTAYTCKGADVAPALTWTGVPEGTVELALVVTDPDAGDFVHWIVSGIDPTATALDGTALPAGAVEAENSSGTTGWVGPCPPEGTSHRYLFTLYALSESALLDPGTKPADALAIIRGNAPSSAEYTGTFT
jgi:Raf kinase inhibitor-like YbhB/YbcL family protein